MKKLLSLLVTALLVGAALTSCGGSESGDDSGKSGISDTKAAVYTVTLDSGAVIKIGDDADPVISALGTHLDLMEAPSCVHEGTDRVYMYDGYTVTTSPRADGSQYVAEITLTSDVVALDNGVYIGCSVDELTAAFGDDYKDSFGVYTYTLEGATVSAVIDGDAVSALTISSADAADAK